MERAQWKLCLFFVAPDKFGDGVAHVEIFIKNKFISNGFITLVRPGIIVHDADFHAFCTRSDFLLSFINWSNVMGSLPAINFTKFVVLGVV